MSINLDNLSQRLSRKAEALDLANAIFRDCLFPDAPFSEEDISKELLSSLVLSYVKNNIDIIFTYATSSIEKIFLSSLLMWSLRKGVLFLEINEPIRTTIGKIDIIRKNYNLAMQIWNVFKLQTGRRSMNDFLNFVYGGSREIGLDVPEDYKLQFRRDMLMHIYARLKTYLVCLKCNFSDIISSGKHELVDIFIWSMSNPDFRMVIEFDEANYYEDKATFSNDRSRDRFLQSRGFRVLRFSGDEIISDPLGKAWELISFLEAQR